MNRRRLLNILAGLPFMNGLWPMASASAESSAPPARVRPGDPAWPSDESWDQLGREVGGRLIKVRSPLAACVAASSDAACAQVFKELKNPYYLGDEVGLTQSLGWIGAWTSQPSVYAVAAKTTQRCRRRGQFRAKEQSAAGGEGRRPQLPGNVERGRLAPDLDAADERGRRCTTLSSAPDAKGARSRSRPCRSSRARSGDTSTTR